MYYTNEYTVLKSQNGGEDVILKPGIYNAFNAFEGEYKATSSAYIVSLETKEIVQSINVGVICTGVGVVPKPKKPKPKETLLESDDG